MCSIQEIMNAPLLQLTKPKELSHGMKIYRSDDVFSIKLDVTIPFGPSVFNGTGDEERMSLLLSISKEIFKSFKMISDDFKAQLTELHPYLDSKWTDSTKEATEKYDSNLRVKINVKGDKACKYYDLEGSSTDSPKTWKGLKATVVIRIGGGYIQPRGAGLLLDVTHLRYDPNQQSEANPFA